MYVYSVSQYVMPTTNANHLSKQKIIVAQNSTKKSIAYTGIHLQRGLSIVPHAFLKRLLHLSKPMRHGPMDMRISSMDLTRPPWYPLQSMQGSHLAI